MALGKGLGALLNTDNVLDNVLDNKNIIELKISQVEPNKNQPRRDFDEKKLAALAESIEEYGVITPIVVKKLDNGFYKIIAGERRWRASKIAGKKTIPAVLKEYDDKETMEVALIENLQRENLNPFEEAKGFKELMDIFSLTQDEVAKKVGKSRSAIANSIRLLSLPEKIKGYVLEEKLSVGHVRAILSIENDEIRIITAEKIIEKGMNVRQTEDYIASLLKEPKTKKKSPLEEEMKRYFATLEKKLSNQLKTKVCIHRGRKKGKIEIEYYNNEDFERLMKIFNK
ncbi:MAG: ParB/RepB/Spo0J family partition protein [Ruminococcaceae bacterium]|nr:ParB/RepB/Spo0J family partition protein [Oscillospiraceae bacterium]